MNSIILAYFLNLEGIRNKPSFVVKPIAIVKVEKWVDRFDKSIVLHKKEPEISQIIVTQQGKCFIIGGF